MKNGVMDRSISNIAAQLLDEEPSSIRFVTYPFLIISVKSTCSPGETNSENQAKVVNHIKGLLNDIVSNTIVDDDNMTGQSGGGVDSPTILQTVFNLDTNTIKVLLQKTLEEHVLLFKCGFLLLNGKFVKQHFIVTLIKVVKKLELVVLSLLKAFNSLDVDLWNLLEGNLVGLVER